MTETKDISNFDELTRKIIGCYFEVHNTLGPSFLEKIYVNGLKIKLKQKGLSFETEKESYWQVQM